MSGRSQLKTSALPISAYGHGRLRSNLLTSFEEIRRNVRTTVNTSTCEEDEEEEHEDDNDLMISWKKQRSLSRLPPSSLLKMTEWWLIFTLNSSVGLAKKNHGDSEHSHLCT